MKAVALSAAILAFPLTGSAFCYREAADRYQINPELLQAIAYVESRGRPEATNLGHLQRTRTYDIGVMQINSSWLPKLANFGITEDKLRDPCQNIMVGAWILANHMNEDGADWNGVGAYNASCRTLSKQRCQAARGDYTWKVYRAMLRGRADAPGTGVAQRRRIGAEKLLASADTSLAVKASPAAQSQRRITSVYVEDDVATTRIPVTTVAVADNSVPGAVWRDSGREANSIRVASNDSTN